MLFNVSSFAGRRTCDLIHESESSSAVCFVLLLSDPDVELVGLVSAVIVEELQTLDFTVSRRGHCLALQSGCVALVSALSAEVHEERRPCRHQNSCNCDGSEAFLSNN